MFVFKHIKALVKFGLWFRVKRSAAAPLGTNLLPPLSKTEVQGRGEAEVSASNRYENVASLEKGHALLFNKDCQWVRLIRNKMETVSLGGQAEVICVRGENRIDRGEQRGGKERKESLQYFETLLWYLCVQGPWRSGQCGPDSGFSGDSGTGRTWSGCRIMAAVRKHGKTLYNLQTSTLGKKHICGIC